jgi:DNA-binding CsgD family transcriptional regulator
MLCNKFICISIFVLHFVLGIQGYSQQKNYTQIDMDQLIRVADSLYEKDKLEQAKIAYDQIVKGSMALKYSKGLAFGYHGLSKISWFEGKVDESTQFLILANQEVYTQSDPHLKSRIYFSMGLNLHTILMFNDALKYYKLSMNLADQIKDPKLRNEMRNYSILHMGDIMDYTGKTDSAIYYYQNALKHPDSDLETKIVASLGISELYFKMEKIDSVNKYNNLMKSFLPFVPHSQHYDYYMKEMDGKFELLKGNYEKALSIFHLIQKKDFQLRQSHIDTYKYMAESFKRLGVQDSSAYYLEKFLAASAEIEERNKQTIFNNKKVPMMMYAEEKKSIKSKHTARIAMIFAASLLIIIPSIYLLVKQKKKLSANQNETQVLKKQLNVSFEEIIDLAKSNSPNFLPRFLEVYPDFHRRLMEIEPSLTSSELLLAAYLKLDFSTKEIADYNFVSVRTVQNRRYRLRKKLNLDAKIDLNYWLQNLKLHPKVVEENS